MRGSVGASGWSSLGAVGLIGGILIGADSANDKDTYRNNLSHRGS